jgi:hypothetical protein
VAVTLRRRSEVGAPTGTRVPVFPRTTNGNINNCALANGDFESNCQICGGSCPDRGRFVGAEALEAEVAERSRARAAAEAVEQKAGERAFAEAAGVVEVTWGDELFQPLPYNAIRVGPFKATTVVRPGETVAEAVLRLHAELARAAREVFGEKKRVYLSELAALVRDARDTEVP